MKPKLVLSCVVTESHFKEFLLLKFSAELFHDCQWYLACDEYSYNQLADQSNCHRLNSKLQNGKVFGTEEEIKNFYSIINGKFDAAYAALADHPQVLMVDTDIIFCDTFVQGGTESLDAAVSPHFQWNAEMDKAWGIYNAGFVIIQNTKFLDKWRELTNSGKFQFEQVPLEETCKTGAFNVSVISVESNMGWWRFNNEKSQYRYQSFSNLGDKHLLFDGRVVNSFHFHTFVNCRHSEYFKDVVFNHLLIVTENGRKIIEYYNQLKS